MAIDVPISTIPQDANEGLQHLVLLVGAFPPADNRVVGGVVTSCRALIDSGALRRFRLYLLDSTQYSNPPPAFPVRALLAMRRLARYMAQAVWARPDVVVIFTSSGAGLVEKSVMAWFARLLRIPVMMAPRGGRLLNAYPRSRALRLMAPLLFGGVTRVVCQGAAWRRFVVEGLGFADRDSPVIPNWTADEGFLRVGEERGRVPVVFSPVRYVFVGWMEESKGVLDLLQSFLRLHKYFPIELDLVGDGKCMKVARETIAQAGADSSVRFHGWIPRSQVMEVLRDSDIFVLPSWEEGLPNSMIEAMASGLPVVVSRVGNIPDVVSDGVHGRLVEPRNLEELFHAMRQLGEDASARRRMAEAAHELARTTFDPRTNIMAFVREIEDLAHAGGRSRRPAA